MFSACTYRIASPEMSFVKDPSATFAEKREQLCVEPRDSKAVLLSSFLDGKKSRDVADCPAFCHFRSMLYTFAFRSSELRLLLSEHGHHGGVDLQFFSMLFKEQVSVLDPKLSMVLRRLLRVVLSLSHW